MRAALVTGASTGIGRVCARGLRDAGLDVWRGAQGGGRVRSVEGNGLRPLRLDVTDDEQVAAAVGELLDTAEELGVLVNNAGIAVPDRSRRCPSVS